jgi:hypothetical protein
MASVEVASPRGGEQIGYVLEPTWGAIFTWARYNPPTGYGARHHCVFCWAIFVEPGCPEPEARIEGYMTCVSPRGGGDHDFWVCDSCFHEHKDEFAWQIAPANLH